MVRCGTRRASVVDPKDDDLVPLVVDAVDAIEHAERTPTGAEDAGQLVVQLVAETARFVENGTRHPSPTR